MTLFIYNKELAKLFKDRMLKVSSGLRNNAQGIARLSYLLFILVFYFILLIHLRTSLPVFLTICGVQSKT